MPQLNYMSIIFACILLKQVDLFPTERRGWQEYIAMHERWKEQELCLTMEKASQETM